ncbi:putative fatty acyl-CoA reductase CG5065 isoform X19 [Spodoptera frugiperda]|uniref:Fatty acyl-CoA reductase n=1 Tax=Spodoptera frugiperda TaxID=7108 RepID=A0A9R0F0L6_SPOFR|nr:putative fatty acyl-CoA reductase CG5065 isoform X2 [Spodoptera frugiperda]XP_050558217.1 putative fatty acyl-CoA reductase CG5065 isoform X3 [Spodoptera frugiperda]XP_050558218.1 putative fatty acyl-CoA reductase CG5065 isoform X4 [Spodoptera frugiperda]XP_050558219.1 putative fatty acyl-CoA reductase CG5065 isoform X5 [Spodoptera frugiperda]XP_050558220.1 putative fatty acyl-CoA reductase CG5065 isoform X6 [Spodoptera frugiperda]XP_050558222.1 putative fatty acyl-CoA reductase CG5065 isof
MVPRPAPQSATPPLIPEYFAGREVLITGATGFMGKVLVERLLWTCPDIARLHLLMRHKKDCAPDKRLALLKQSQVFDVVREQCPQQLDKLCVLPGDVTKPGFGLDQVALHQLNQVSVVFHSAATLKFDEPLAAAAEQNVRPVLTLMDICDQLANVQVFIHVSTAYSNAELCAVEERVYAAPLAPRRLLALVDALPPALLQEITPRLIAPKPNTYTFTKAVAESAVSERAPAAHYACAIFRPSIVVSSLRHPFPGWIENLNGPSGVVAGAGKGLLRVLRCAARRRADMMPVDMAIDTLIAVAWETGVDDTREARVYQCASSAHAATWGQFRARMLRLVRAHPFDGALWYPWGVICENTVIQKALETVLQTAPLCLAHCVLKACGLKQKPSLWTACKRLQAMNQALQFFATRHWEFGTARVQRLAARLHAEDTLRYNLRPETIDWEQHCVDFVKGTRRYLLRERDSDIPAARRRMKLLTVVHNATLLFAIFIMCRFTVRTAPAILRGIAVLTRLRNKTALAS